MSFLPCPAAVWFLLKPKHALPLTFRNLNRVFHPTIVLPNTSVTKHRALLFCEPLSKCRINTLQVLSASDSLGVGSNYPTVFVRWYFYATVLTQMRKYYVLKEFISPGCYPSNRGDKIPQLQYWSTSQCLSNSKYILLFTSFKWLYLTIKNSIDGVMAHHIYQISFMLH